MALIKNGDFVTDAWHSVADEEALAAGVPSIISLTRWRDDAAGLKAHDAPLGLRLLAGENPEDLGEDVHLFSLIELTFPAFKDGRAYSYARILRQDLGYEGELRAAGEVLRSQLRFMHRVGFDAYEVDERITPDVLAHELGRYKHRYQPSSDTGESILTLRRSA